MLALKAEDTVITVAPDLGACVFSFTVAGADVLRRTSPGETNPLRSSSFPIVPWVNRVANGRFFAADQMITLARNVEGEDHPLHGHGWLTAWTVDDQTTSTASLSYRHAPDAWPWAYEATHTFEVEPGKALFTLSVTNRTDEPMPLGLGFHPYFERPAKLSINVDGMWHTGPDLLPDRWDEVDAFRATPVDGRVLDNCFTGWDRRAVIDGPAGRVQLQADLELLHIYAPRGGSAFCLEPVSAAPDALNHPNRGLTMLASGATATVAMRLALNA